MAEAQQMVQLVNYFLHRHHTPASVHAFQKTRLHTGEIRGGTWISSTGSPPPSARHVCAALFATRATAALHLPAHLQAHHGCRKTAAPELQQPSQVTQKVRERLGSFNGGQGITSLVKEKLSWLFPEKKSFLLK